MVYANRYFMSQIDELTVYAGFWRRLAAMVIDTLVITGSILLLATIVFFIKTAVKYSTFGVTSSRRTCDSLDWSGN